MPCHQLLSESDVTPEEPAALPSFILPKAWVFEHQMFLIPQEFFIKQFKEDQKEQ